MPSSSTRLAAFVAAAVLTLSAAIPQAFAQATVGPAGGVPSTTAPSNNEGTPAGGTGTLGTQRVGPSGTRPVPNPNTAPMATTPTTPMATDGTPRRHRHRHRHHRHHVRTPAGTPTGTQTGTQSQTN